MFLLEAVVSSGPPQLATPPADGLTARPRLCLGVATAGVDVGAASDGAAQLDPAALVPRLTAGGRGKVPTAGEELPAALRVLLPATAGVPGVQYSTVQYSTVQYNTVQYSTA